MTTMADAIIPKSDQWNADDFLTGPRTFTIREVTIREGEQPVNIFFAGSDKAYRPCKSMCRVLVQAWGPDAKQYVGRSLSLYRDPAVKWAGIEVGGIRISHLSHIDGKIQMQLTATRGSRKPFVVSPIAATPVDHDAERLLAQAREQAAYGTAIFREHWKRLSKPQQATLQPHVPVLKAAAEAADAAMDAGEAREPGEEG